MGVLQVCILSDSSSVRLALAKVLQVLFPEANVRVVSKGDHVPDEQCSHLLAVFSSWKSLQECLIATNGENKTIATCPDFPPLSVRTPTTLIRGSWPPNVSELISLLLTADEPCSRDESPGDEVSETLSQLLHRIVDLNRRRIEALHKFEPDSRLSKAEWHGASMVFCFKPESHNSLSRLGELLSKNASQTRFVRVFSTPNEWRSQLAVIAHDVSHITEEATRGDFDEKAYLRWRLGDNNSFMDFLWIFFHSLPSEWVTLEVEKIWKMLEPVRFFLLCIWVSDTYVLAQKEDSKMSETICEVMKTIKEIQNNPGSYKLGNVRASRKRLADILGVSKT